MPNSTGNVNNGYVTSCPPRRRQRPATRQALNFGCLPAAVSADDHEPPTHPPTEQSTIASPKIGREVKNNADLCLAAMIRGWEHGHLDREDADATLHRLQRMVDFTIEYDLNDQEAIGTIRRYEDRHPFAGDITDKEILDQCRRAEACQDGPVRGGALLPEDFTITCGGPDRYGKQRFVANVQRNSHEHLFNVHDQFQRSKFCSVVVEKFHLGPGATDQIEDRVREAASSNNSEHVTAEVIKLAEVVVRPVSWLWEQYIPRGAITLLEGDPGVMKSTIALNLAARNSLGACMPPDDARPGARNPDGTLIISGEDDVERTIKARLLAAGACLERCRVLSSVCEFGERRSVQLPRDIGVVEKIITEQRITLVVIDVLACFTEDGVSMNDDASMRRLTTALTAMAGRTQVAVLAIRHHNKKTGTSAMHRGGGSIGIVGAARSALTVALHPNDPSEFVLAVAKHNLCARPLSLTFRAEIVGDVARIEWGDRIQMTANELLNARAPRTSKLDEAQAIIAQMLADGHRPETEVLAACVEQGISERTFTRARTEMGVLARKVGFGSSGYWSLSLASDDSLAAAVEDRPTCDQQSD